MIILHNILKSIPLIVNKIWRYMFSQKCIFFQTFQKKNHAHNDAMHECFKISLVKYL